MKAQHFPPVIFIVLLTLFLPYVLWATIAAVWITVYLHMGGPGWQTFLFPLLFFVLSYLSVWFVRNKTAAICGAVINCSIILAMKPFNMHWFICLVYSALWFGATRDVARIKCTR